MAEPGRDRLLAQVNPSPQPPSAPVDAAAAGPAQALRLVSILFLDIVGSTSLAQRLDPEEIHAVLDGALARYTAAVLAHGGRVLQYAGDNLLAAFGAAEVKEDDAECAVRCGLALLALARGVGQEVQAAYGHHGFDVRIGIHTGSVLLGGGVDAEGTIRGAAVNVAARLEQAAPPGGLLISVDTCRLVQDRFDVQPAQALQMKGIDAPLQTFRVERERPRSAQRGPRSGVEGVSVALVGRDDDMAALHAALQAVRTSGALQAVTLIGDAGLGKSRLLAEFEAVANGPAAGATAPGTATATGVWHACAHPRGLHQPYAVLRDLLFRRCDVQDDDPQAVAQAKLGAGLAALFGARAAEQTALLGQLIGLDYRSSPFIAGILEDGRQLRARAFHAWVEFLRLASEQLPPAAVPVLVLDDLHWADDGSLDAVAHLATAGRDLRLLLLCAARPEVLQRRPLWGGDWPAHHSLAVRTLDADDRQALASALLQPLGPHPGAPQLHALLVERTDGNPFYMQALLQMLADQGVLNTAHKPWQLTLAGLQQLQVPGTLVGVLQARLDALAAADRRALQQASVVGAVFWDGALAALDAQSPTALPALCQRTLVQTRQHSTFGEAAEFSFGHHLLHEVTYGTVLKRDKRAHHHRAALWLEARSAGREAEFAGLVAEHFERAGVDDRAAAHWARAAREATERHADSAALAHADRALALDGEGGDVQRRFALLRVRAAVWSRRGDVAQHQQATAALETLAEAEGDAVWRLIAAQSRMHRLCMDGAYEAAYQLGTRCLAAAEGCSPIETAKVHNYMVMALGRHGRNAEAREHVAVGLALARACGDAYVEASLLNNLSVGELNERRFAQALASAGQALAVYQRIGSRFGAAIASLNLALGAELAGRMADAREQLLQLLPQCDAIGHHQASSQGRANLSCVLAELGEPQAALDHALDGIRLAQRLGDQYIQTIAHGGAVLGCHLLQRWTDMAGHARQAMAGFAISGQPADALANQAALAVALHRGGDEAAARDTLEAVLAAVAGRGGWQADEADAAGWCCRVLQLQADPRAAAAREAACAGWQAQATVFDDLAARQCFLQATVLRREMQPA